MLNIPVNRLRIATPCHARWEDMAGNERARFCGQCQKHVYNLSALTATAAADLVREKEGHLCARFYQRADGTILHGKDCPVGLAARQWRRVKSFAGAAASLVLLFLGVNKVQAGDSTHNFAPAKPAEDGKVLMGDVAAPASPTPSPKPSATPVKPAEDIAVLMGEICVPTPTPKPTPKPE